MAAETHDIEICRGSVFRMEQVLRDAVTLLGTDLTVAGAEIRMQIRNPDAKSDTIVISLTQTPTANGSVITITPEEEIPATAITTFAAAGVTTVTGAGFVVSTVVVTELDDDTGDPVDLTTTDIAVAKIGDLAVVAGSTSNDGNYRLWRVTDADTVTLLPAPTVEAAAGTLQVLRQGRFEVVITAEDSNAAIFDFEVASYDIEWVSATGEQPIRILEGTVTVSHNTTR